MSSIITFNSLYWIKIISHFMIKSQTCPSPFVKSLKLQKNQLQMKYLRRMMVLLRQMVLSPSIKKMITKRGLRNFNV